MKKKEEQKQPMITREEFWFGLVMHAKYGRSGQITKYDVHKAMQDIGMWCEEWDSVLARQDKK